MRYAIVRDRIAHGGADPKSLASVRALHRPTADPFHSASVRSEALTMLADLAASAAPVRDVSALFADWRD